jgi:hypothetical protein
MAAPNGKKAPESPVVMQIATALGETKPMALGQLKRIVQTIGDERSLAILQQALEVEQQGGLMLADGKASDTRRGLLSARQRTDDAGGAPAGLVLPTTRQGCAANRAASN